MKGGESKEEKKKEKKVAGWSTKMTKEVASKKEFEDTEEMVQWRSISEEDIHELWTALCGRMEEEVLEKYNAEEAKKRAYEGRGQPLEWRILKKEKRYPPRKMVWRLTGENVLMVQRTLPAAKQKNEGRRNTRGKDQTAADHEDYGRHDEEDEGKRHN